MRINNHILIMSTTAQIDKTETSSFWDAAIQYAHSVEEDEPFVQEMAYVMVTLHRTGA